MDEQRQMARPTGPQRPAVRQGAESMMALLASHEAFPKKPCVERADPSTRKQQWNANDPSQCGGHASTILIHCQGV
jgi:hypothetical protein